MAIGSFLPVILYDEILLNDREICHSPTEILHTYLILLCLDKLFTNVNTLFSETLHTKKVRSHCKVETQYLVVPSRMLFDIFAAHTHL